MRDRSVIYKDAASIRAYIEIIADYQHWRIAASSLAFYFDNRKFAVFGGLTRFDPPEVFTYSVEDFRRATKHAGCSSADLNKMLANRFPWFEICSVIMDTGRQNFKTHLLNMV
jgi:hypothetical protein